MAKLSYPVDHVRPPRVCSEHWQDGISGVTADRGIGLYALVSEAAIVFVPRNASEETITAKFRLAQKLLQEFQNERLARLENQRPQSA